jgi:hypothetical protein
MCVPCKWTNADDTRARAHREHERKGVGDRRGEERARAQKREKNDGAPQRETQSSTLFGLWTSNCSLRGWELLFVDASRPFIVPNYCWLRGWEILTSSWMRILVVGMHFIYLLLSLPSSLHTFFTLWIIIYRFHRWGTSMSMFFIQKLHKMYICLEFALKWNSSKFHINVYSYGICIQKISSKIHINVYSFEICIKKTLSQICINVYSSKISPTHLFDMKRFLCNKYLIFYLITCTSMKHECLFDFFSKTQIIALWNTQRFFVNNKVW